MSRVLLLALLVTTGCGLSPFPEKSALCELRPKADQCTDIRHFRGPSLVTFQGVCTTLVAAKQGGAGYSEGKTCSTTDMWGGCQAKSLDGSEQTNWYYKGSHYMTVDNAKSECSTGQSWVDPQ
jgi:hypothetical protein